MLQPPLRRSLGSYALAGAIGLLLGCPGQEMAGTGDDLKQNPSRDLSMPGPADLAAGADLTSSDLASGACGDPVLMARYPTCRMALDQASCMAAGGTWAPGGKNPQPICICPTGQEGCVCKRSSQCLAGCSAPLSDGANRCMVTEGRCEARGPRFGCFCRFDNDGSVAALCVD